MTHFEDLIVFKLHAFPPTKNNLNFAAFKYFKIFTIWHEKLVSPGLLLW